MVIEVCNGKTGQREEEEDEQEESSSRYCSSAFESLFFDTFKEESSGAGANIEEQMKEYAAMNVTINDYDASKEKLWGKSFIPRSQEQTRRRRANVGKMYYIQNKRNEEVDR